MFVERNNQFSVVCNARVAHNCSENGGWCDSEEEAHDWVEDECWIFSGEGWFCIECNSHYMRNLSQTTTRERLEFNVTRWMGRGSGSWNRHRKINTQSVSFVLRTQLLNDEAKKERDTQRFFIAVPC